MYLKVLCTCLAWSKALYKVQMIEQVHLIVKYRNSKRRIVINDSKIYKHTFTMCFLSKVTNWFVPYVIGYLLRNKILHLKAFKRFSDIENEYDAPQKSVSSILNFYPLVCRMSAAMKKRASHVLGT